VIVKLDQIFNGLPRAIAKHNGEISEIHRRRLVGNLSGLCARKSG
jgi:hypothetical protein